MTRILYCILLAAETLLGIPFMISLWDSSLYLPLAIAVVSVVALLTWQIVMLTKTTDVALKRKIRWRIALIMLIPIAVFAVTYFILAIAFAIAFISGGY